MTRLDTRPPMEPVADIPAPRPQRAVALKAMRSLFGAFSRSVPPHIIVVAGSLGAVGVMAGGRLPPDSVLAAIGAWTLTLVLILIGLVCGAAAGVAAGVALVTRGVGDALGDRLNRMTPDEGRRVIPTVSLADARTSYEKILDRLVGDLLGRLRVPAFLRRLLRKGMRQSMVEEFLADCEQREVNEIGFAEVRNWAMLTGLPHALAPVHARVRVVRVISLGIPALLAALVLTLIAVA